jgi:hypothetical protein
VKVYEDVFLAYPTAPRDVTEQLAKDHFMDSLTDFDTKLRVQQSRRATLNDAVRLAVEIEDFSRAHREKGHTRQTNVQQSDSSSKPSQHESSIQDLQRAIENLSGQIKSHLQGKETEKENRPQNVKKPKTEGRPKCHKCKEIGHYTKVLSKYQGKGAGGKV